MPETTTTTQYHQRFMTAMKRRNPPVPLPVQPGSTPRLLSFLQAMGGTVPPQATMPTQVKQTLPKIPTLPELQGYPASRKTMPISQKPKKPFPFVGY